MNNKNFNKRTPKIVIGAVTVVDEDGEKARQKAKQEVALYLPIIAKLDHTFNVEENLLQEIQSSAQKFEFKTAAGFISDKMLDKFAFAGTPDEIIDQSRKIFEVGAQRIEFGTPHGITSKNGIDLIGHKILPTLKQSRSESK